VTSLIIKKNSPKLVYGKKSKRDMNLNELKKIKVAKVRQQFNNPSPANFRGMLQRELLKLNSIIKPGKNIAIAVGSRGISNLAAIVSDVVAYVKSQNALPFIFPAMGSHGGATAKGQEQVLESYGITEQSAGAPIKSALDTIELQPVGGVRVFMDKFAFESDGVILVNRIKPHTDFHAKYESGLVKMSVIGLGNQKQALEIHRLGLDGLREQIPKVAEQIFGTGKIIAGVGIVEDSIDRTNLIRVLPANEIFAGEPKLLERSRSFMPSLPVRDIDVLIIDRIGKNISGVGLDTNIIGRFGIPGQTDPDYPNIRSIVLNDLTDESHGNAIGLGLADVITRQLFDKIDFKVTFENAYTSSFLDRVKIPVIAENVPTALKFGLRNCGQIPPSEARIIRIQDTLHLEYCFVSQPIYRELSGKVETITGINPLFDDQGKLESF
jgi:hypothetical protein